MTANRCVLAGIVTYHPDPFELTRLVGRIAPQVEEILIVANSDLPDALAAQLGEVSGPTPLRVRRAAGNEGLGAAYNGLASRARAGGFGFVLLLDQDSLPGPGCVAALRAGFAALEAAGERPALLGPRPVGPGGAPLKAPPPLAGRAAEGRLVPVAFAISSGSLIRREALDAVGPFRSDFFIDGIDVEWCLRAAAAGFTVWRAEDEPMAHALGRGVIRLPFGLRLADQPPARVYTAIRNQLALLRLAHVPARLKARMLLALPLRIAAYLVRARASREIRSALWCAVRDGATLRLGPPGRRFRPAPAGHRVAAGGRAGQPRRS
ncbi:glycosyl transferase family 2 [Methylobacterium sp. 4-46]|uniref:glycosyltransferase n=1 Tax=unclassified Methylobacterium TaxID=2615210 RepID=UPI000152E09C|nr:MULTISPECIES: glycosyltransferase family 2 protein [Methylobacterium]ACA19650.1 glycosyl transferase family 2 [Methylobacterium sp. 4-46]WFT78846.1 glycosyltransferase [Methylobacterium nodulans]